jgi:hypothetical protein
MCPPLPTVQGTIVITSRLGDVSKPLWYSASEQNDRSYQMDSASWPGYVIIGILNAFNPLRG